MIWEQGNQTRYEETKAVISFFSQTPTIVNLSFQFLREFFLTVENVDYREMSKYKV